MQRARLNSGSGPVSVRHRLTVVAAAACLGALPVLGRAQGGGPAELAAAAEAGDRARVIELISAGADSNAVQGDGTSALHWAVYRLDRDMARALLAAGAEPSARNSFGSTPLAEAISAANFDLVSDLLAAGADPESPNADGQTALMLAARSNRPDIVAALLEHGAQVNAREAWRGQSALMWAADARSPEIVRLLLANGADVTFRSVVNDWPSQITSEPRAQYRPTGGLTALLYAARSGCTDCVAAMLEAGAVIDRPNPDGVTPLMMAIDNFGFDAAALLIERGANVHVADWWGRTPLYVAVDMNSFGGRGNRPPAPQSYSAFDLVQTLLARNVNVNPQLTMHRPGRGSNSSRFVDDLLTTGATPLLRAAIGLDLAAIEALLGAGALVDLPNIMGVTPLMAAAGMGISRRDRRLVFSGDMEARVIAAAEVLLAAGADINARVTDVTSRNARIARSSTMTDRGGQSVLFGAVKWGWPGVVRFLLERGADPAVIDHQGMTARDLAEGRAGGRDNEVSAEVAALLPAR